GGSARRGPGERAPLPSGARRALPARKTDRPSRPPDGVRRADTARGVRLAGGGGKARRRPSLALRSLHHRWMLALASLPDAGVRDVVWKRVPHPVAAMGALIDWLDGRLNRPRLNAGRRRAAGAFALAVVVAIVAAIGYALEALFAAVPYGWIGTVAVAAVLLA